MPILKEWVSFIMGDNFQVNAMIHSQDIGFSTPLKLALHIRATLDMGPVFGGLYLGYPWE